MEATLSVCIITQNQAAHLPPLLDQASAIAGEIVLVDGGSTDGTAALAARYPKARLLERPFDGNFVAQKNFALDAARSEWVLFLDTDELLGPLAVRVLPRLLRSPFRSVSFPLYWLAQSDPPLYVDSPAHYPNRKLRLFRNRPDFRYDARRPVHEYLPREIREPRLRLHHCHLLHYSFLWVDRAGREEKVRRYDALSPELADSNRRMYLYEDQPHRLRPCREAWAGGRPFVACPLDYWRERARLWVKSLPLRAAQEAVARRASR